jgi:hypothetical protein
MFLIFFALTAFYQTSNAQVKSRIIFKDGRKITGVIIDTKNIDSVFLNLDGNFNIGYNKNEIQEIESLHNFVNLGIGFGLPYGLFGINAEVEPLNFISITAGVGTTFFAGAAWQIGATVYFLDQSKMVRPRITLLYGVNSVIIFDNNNGFSGIANESFLGLSLGAGVKIKIGESHGFNADLFYLLIDKSLDRQKELEQDYGMQFENVGLPVKFSLGYYFNL